MTENKGHVHAESHAEYSKDMFESEEPWNRWQYRRKTDIRGEYPWYGCTYHPLWNIDYEYRREPATE